MMDMLIVILMCSINFHNYVLYYLRARERDTLRSVQSRFAIYMYYNVSFLSFKL